jgi:hypothetical protein
MDEPASPPPERQREEGASVEIHPPHAPIHSIRDFLIQLLTITAGVLIALSLEGLLEWNHHRLLVREARATMTREITENKSALDRHLAGGNERAKDVDTSLQLANDLLKTKKSDIRELQLSFHAPSFSAAGWQSAERTGAVAYMEYADVQRYAKLYGFQDLYDTQVRRVMERTVSTLATLDDDPHVAEPRDLERFREALLGLRGDLLFDAQLGEQLSKAYAEMLSKQ